MKFQIIYKQAIYSDGFESLEEALESLEFYTEKYGIDEKYLSIEIEIDRDRKRHDGLGDTRASLEELCVEFMDKEHNNAIAKIEKMKEVLK